MKKKYSLDIFILLISNLIFIHRVLFATYNALLSFFPDLVSVMLLLRISSPEIVLASVPSDLCDFSQFSILIFLHIICSI